MAKVAKVLTGNEIRSVLQANKGLAAVIRKELADYLSGKRFVILSSLVVIACLAALYVAAGTIRDAVGRDQLDFVFLKLFTTSGPTLPFSFISFISFLGPVIGLIMGFDAINGERDRGTLSRILSQPIYRDALVNGKFLAGVAVLAMVVFGLGMLVAGLGLLLTGVPPTWEEVLRVFAYLTLSVIYISFWLSLAMLFSILFRQTSTSALAGIAVWLFLVVFVPLLAGMVANAIYPVTDASGIQQLLANTRWQQGLSRISPTTLFDEATATLLDPSVRTLSRVILAEQVYGSIKGALSFGQSLLLVWPHVVGLFAGTSVCFAIAYIVFMRQEIRA